MLDPIRLQQEIQNASGISSAQWMEQKTATENQLPGNLTVLDCPKCMNKGYTVRVDGGYYIRDECDCMPQRRALWRIKRSGLSDLIEEYTFSRYQTPEKWQEVAKSKAIRFLDQPGAWFCISGTPGSGKTHLCTAIASELIKAGKEVRYMLWRSEAPRLKSLINSREEYEQLMREYRDTEVLYIDDFFKGTVTDPDKNLAFELLNDRYNSRKTMTIISSEKTIEEILAIDEAIGSRMYERSKGYYVKTAADNWRLRND